jgi:hypothetical protein
MKNRALFQVGIVFLSLCLLAAGAVVVAGGAKDARASIGGSTVELITPSFVLPSTAYDFAFRVTNNGGEGVDGEYIKTFALTLPTGYAVNSVADPAALHPENDVTWQHTIASTLVTWEAVGNESGYGDIISGESLDFTLNATTGASATTAPWTLTGDNFGAEPHVVSGNLEIPLIGVGVTVTPATQSGYGKPGTDVEYVINVFNNTGADSTFDVTFGGNDWDTVASPNPVSIDNVNDADVGITVTVDSGAEPYVDTDTVTITVTDQANPSYTDSVTITTGAIGDELFYDDGSREAQIGCSKKGPCVMANIFDAGGAATVEKAKYLISADGGITQPNPIAVVIYNATSGGPTGGTLASIADTAPAFDTWREVTFSPPVPVNGWFAVGIDQTGEFASLGIDTNGPFAGRSYVSTDDGASWSRVDQIGIPELVGNFMIRAIMGAGGDDDDDTADDDTADDDTDDDDDDDDDDDTTDDDSSDDDTDDDDSGDDDDLVGDDDDSDDDACGC